MSGPLRDANRAVAPVVGKALEAGIVVLYVTVVAGALYGHAVPAYRTSAGDAVAERTVAAAAQRVEGAVPAAGSDVDVRTRVNLPATIEGESYRISAANRTLVLDHADAGVTARERLALPPDVVAVRGTWASDQATAVRVVSTERGLVVELSSRGERP